MFVVDGLLFVNVDPVKVLSLDRISTKNLSFTYLVDAGSCEFDVGTGNVLIPLNVLLVRSGKKTLD